MTSNPTDSDRIAEMTAGQLRLALRQCHEQLAALEGMITESRHDNHSPPDPQAPDE